MPKTNLDKVKAVARMLLMTDIHETEFSPVIVQHPFTSTGICVLTNDGENKLIDITKSEDDLRSWREYFLNQINKSKSAYQIFVMINKPYGLTFLKCAQPYISNEEFSKILADAWIRSEYPNSDGNLSKSELIAMFKQAKPFIMNTEERKQFSEMDDIVTIYRGVTPYNGKSVKALSWTLDRSVAEFFAHRFGEQGSVYEAQIRKDHILALFLMRGEKEVIVDPEFLTNLSESQEPQKNNMQCL